VLLHNKSGHETMSRATGDEVDDGLAAMAMGVATKL